MRNYIRTRQYQVGQIIRNIPPLEWTNNWERIGHGPWEGAAGVILLKIVAYNAFKFADEQKISPGDLLDRATWTKVYLQFDAGLRLSLEEIAQDSSAWPENTGIVVKAARKAGASAQVVYRKDGQLWYIEEAEIDLAPRPIKDIEDLYEASSPWCQIGNMGQTYDLNLWTEQQRQEVERWREEEETTYFSSFEEAWAHVLAVARKLDIKTPILVAEIPTSHPGDGVAFAGWLPVRIDDPEDWSAAVQLCASWAADPTGPLRIPHEFYSPFSVDSALTPSLRVVDGDKYTVKRIKRRP